MPDWKVLIADSLEDSGADMLAKEANVDNRPTISAEELLADIGQYDALVVRGRTKVTKEVFEAAEKLKVVGRAGVGVDNIDLAAAASQGVTVVNAPTATTTAVAEHAFALMLSLARPVPTADASMKRGQWDKKALKGIELQGKTLGVIGLGNIGSQVAQRATAFGMQAIAYDPLVSAEDISNRGAEPVDLNELYTKADFITLHLPLSSETRNLLDGEAFARMKRGVYLICAARGGVIDETALLSSLESGQVAGAALDVFAKEPPGLTALVAHPKVVATPHIGAQTAEAQIRAAENIAEEILRALRGDELHWKVV